MCPITIQSSLLYEIISQMEFVVLTSFFLQSNKIEMQLFKKYLYIYTNYSTLVSQGFSIKSLTLNNSLFRRVSLLELSTFEIWQVMCYFKSLQLATESLWIYTFASILLKINRYVKSKKIQWNTQQKIKYGSTETKIGVNVNINPFCVCFMWKSELLKFNLK